MFITNILGGFVAATQWHWPRWAVAAVFVPLLALDSVFVAGNMTKLATGGWIPLTLGAVLYFVFLDVAQRTPRAARGACKDGCCRAKTSRS